VSVTEVADVTGQLAPAAWPAQAGHAHPADQAH
jgi:hypothetical protein